MLRRLTFGSVESCVEGGTSRAFALAPYRTVRSLPSPPFHDLGLKTPLSQPRPTLLQHRQRRLPHQHQHQLQLQTLPLRARVVPLRASPARYLLFNHLSGHHHHHHHPLSAPCALALPPFSRAVLPPAAPTKAMKAFFTKKGSGARKPVDKSKIGAPTGFKHVGGSTTMAATAEPIVGGAEETVASDKGAGSTMVEDDVTALPSVAAPPARHNRKGLGKLLSRGAKSALNLRETFRGRKAKKQTKEEAAPVLAAAGASSAKLSTISSANGSQESTAAPPSSCPATPPLLVSPVRRGPPAPPRLPTMHFGPAAAAADYHHHHHHQPSEAAAHRAQTLRGLEGLGSLDLEYPSMPVSAEQKRIHRETSVYGGFTLTPREWPREW
ncbi:hypothetical protein IWZ00DRAFT_493007 [Phyllosticta capitalensis]|uniref:Uncharacterized protein n=1 Tax=Phyllosticta capitalensis TaxID=121624 RepID=A0ABR1YAT1_9PEZI